MWVCVLEVERRRTVLVNRKAFNISAVNSVPTQWLSLSLLSSSALLSASSFHLLCTFSQCSDRFLDLQIRFTLMSRSLRLILWGLEESSTADEQLLKPP